MTSQMMWHLATTNCGVLQPQIASSWHLYAFKKVVASGLNKLCCATAAKVTVCTIYATRLWILFNPITIQDVIFWDHMKHFWMSLPLLLCPITLQGGCYNGPSHPLPPSSATHESGSAWLRVARNLTATATRSGGRTGDSADLLIFSYGKSHCESPSATTTCVPPLATVTGGIVENYP